MDMYMYRWLTVPAIVVACISEHQAWNQRWISANVWILRLDCDCAHFCSSLATKILVFEVSGLRWTHWSRGWHREIKIACFITCSCCGFDCGFYRRVLLASLYLSVCPSVCLHGTTRFPLMDCHEIWYLSIFRKSFAKIKLSLKYDNNVS